jgi:polyisoprenoid-binding protein YceI
MRLSLFDTIPKLNTRSITMRMSFKAITASITLFVSGSAFAAPESFTIDPNHTFPMFAVSHFGISVQRGRFDRTVGKILLDREAKSGSIEVTIDATSINMGFEDWNKHMKGEDFFNVEKFPSMIFKSTKLIFEGDKLVAADGEFILLGVSKPLRLKVSTFACTEHPMLKKLYCGAEVSAEIKRSDFGMKIGIPIVGDDIRLMSPVEAIKD